eukprot:CAMPEP_0173390664 /NCGR_PEP_ID=MMETSP1356-20130122/15747_1 /TAXON_ID=77927 ORGANISM="Hemiselmis virescens, Strain PCC157" /NCGR_SAMPLE_ID=MMETSP1356 /ASSEMBLY_ACC=CAM_ASM_000847 /LENGTH=206 /DNA_ID=CAMNT_0014348113 /DNA_START=214 /DNA_END=834 /DNA_ORIENTATION=-
MVNILPIQKWLARICAALVITGFLIRPASGCAPSTFMHAVEQCSSDRTFEGQTPVVDLGCAEETQWLPADGAARPKSGLKDLRDHTLPVGTVAASEGGKGFLPVVVLRRSVNSLRQMAMHPTQEISHEGCAKRYDAPAPQPSVLDRVFQAIRSPISRLSEKQTVVDPAHPPVASDGVKSFGQVPEVCTLQNHECKHHIRPPTLRAA